MFMFMGICICFCVDICIYVCVFVVVMLFICYLCVIYVCEVLSLSYRTKLLNEIEIVELNFILAISVCGDSRGQDQ